MKTGGFLNPENIRTLINANTNENAPHFIFMTTHGTILGHDASLPTRSARKFGAFAGTTWLRHSKAIAATDEASPEPDFGLNGKTLKVILDEEGKGLRGLVVVVDGVVGAACKVGEGDGLAMVALRNGDDFKEGGEGDEITAAILETGIKTSSEQDSTTADAKTKHQDEDSPNGSDSEDTQKIESEEEFFTTSSTTSSSAPQLSKLRILEIRAETMAEAFAEEICGAEFRMPPDFK